MEHSACQLGHILGWVELVGAVCAYSTFIIWNKVRNSLLQREIWISEVKSGERLRSGKAKTHGLTCMELLDGSNLAAIKPFKRNNKYNSPIKKYKLLYRSLRDRLRWLSLTDSTGQLLLLNQDVIRNRFSQLNTIWVVHTQTQHH